MKNAVIIQKRDVERAYGFMGVEAIVDTDQGRLLITDGFGGQDTLAGGCVRWRHGVVAKLQPTDTFESLEAERWNEYTDLLNAVINGMDDTRPLLGWPGQFIERAAKKLGL